MKDPRDIILSPVVSEKSYALMETGVYTFKVHPSASKPEIRDAVEAIWGVEVRKVNTLNRKGKRRRTRGTNRVGFTSDTKRAIVTLAAGEIPLVATIYNHNAERLVVNGAPIKWKALDPTFGRPNAVAVTKNAQRPHAAMLFVDFMLSPEGQELLKKRNRVPASTAVETNLNKFPFHMIDPVIVLDEQAKWEKIWSELFLKGQAIKRETD